MLFAFTRRSRQYLYDQKFYLASCLSNLVSLLFGVVLLPSVGRIYCALEAVVMLLLLVESLIGPAFEDERYRSRYVAKILMGMGAIGLAIFLIPHDYIIFLPLQMGLLYINVNAVLRSRLLTYACIAFMLLALVRLGISHSSDKLEQLAVMVFFLLNFFLSGRIFRTNKDELEEAERRSEIMRCVFQMVQQLTRHDVRNELQRMQILGMARYRSDRELFLRTMSDFTESLDRIISLDLFASMREVDLPVLLEDLAAVTSQAEFRVHMLDEAPLRGNRNLTFSVLKNLMENCLEAGRRKGIVPRLSLVKAGQTVTLLDNCGGFDTTRIQEGTTSKVDAHRHGVFLRTVTDPAVTALLGFRVELLRIEDGTSAVLTFQEASPLAPDAPMSLERARHVPQSPRPSDGYGEILTIPV